MRLLWMVSALAFGVPFVVPPAVAEETIPLNGILRNRAGQVLPGVTIRGYRRVVPGWQIVTTTTHSDGTFSLTVPKARWVVVVDADELVARGYFCEPGWIGNPGVVGEIPICDVGELPLGVPSSPITCGILGDPIVFQAIPTRPDLTVTKQPGKAPIVHLVYAWTTLPMLTVRRYVIEKSVDMVHWEPVSTIALDGLGRLDLADESSVGQPFCMYRSVETTPVIISP